MAPSWPFLVSFFLLLLWLHKCNVQLCLFTDLIAAQGYLSLDWFTKAKELFYNEKKAEEMSQDESCTTKIMAKKQALRLEECIEVYTAEEKLGQSEAW